VLAHNGFGQPSRNRTDNDLCLKSSRGAAIAGVTGQIKVAGPTLLPKW
jgi:hypothetical protein